MAELEHKAFGSVGSSSPREVKETKKAQSVSTVDLTSLIELGCVKDECVIESYTFRLRSLNTTERLEVAKHIGEDPTSAEFFESNLFALAQSIELINGHGWEDIAGEDAKSSMRPRMNILSKMQISVITKLIDFYAKITKRSDGQFEPEEIKN